MRLNTYSCSLLLTPTWMSVSSLLRERESNLSAGERARAPRRWQDIKAGGKRALRQTVQLHKHASGHSCLLFKQKGRFAVIKVSIIKRYGINHNESVFCLLDSPGSQSVSQKINVGRRSGYKSLLMHPSPRARGP